MKYQLLLLFVIVIAGFLLRFISVTNVPPGLYIDEASIGYNAFQILTTGKDEYGIPHPLFFKSFGDYKVPVYIYAVAGAMAFLGKTELAVRIPSIIAGTLTILVLYLFLQKLLSLETNKDLQKKLKYLPILASFLLAISSWHIHFSRGGFEVTLGTFFYLLGWYLFLLYKTTYSKAALVVSLLSFITAMYTYDSFRLLSPLAILFIGYILKIYRNPKSFPFILLIVLLILPLFLFTFTANGSQRINATSTFSDIKNVTTEQKILIYPLNYLNNYLSFFSLDFLFNYGDGIGRHQIPNFGLIYRWQFLFFLGGIFVLLRQKKSILKNATFLLFFSTPLVAAIAVPSPHSLRSLPLVIPAMICIAVGLIFFFQKITRLKILFMVFIGIVALFELFLYLHFYYIHYPNVNQLDWGAGYKELVLTTEQKQKKYKHIVIDANLQYAPVYFHFYDNKINFTMVSTTWRKPESWGNDSVLYVRPFYGNTHGNNLVANIYLTNINHDIFAQLWKLK